MTPPATLRGTLGVFASYLALSAAWSWPVARLDSTALVTRHFDLYPTVWLLSRSTAAFPSLQHAASAWPVGESLARVDSYVLIVIGWLFGWLVDARVLAALVAWLGPALSALAAERCAANAFGVPRPASWIAGTMYGFGGIAATALLEGHIYHAFDPWLPLCLWAAWRANSPTGNHWHGLAAAAAWALSLATTAYAGVLAAIMLVLVILRGGLARLLPGLLLVALPAGLLYAHLFSMGGRWSDGNESDPTQVLRMGATSLAGLAGWSDAIDLRSHSIGAPVGFTGLGLLLLAPIILRGRPGWRTLWALALVGLFASLGRSIRVDPGSPAWWSPLAWLVDVPGIQYFRFPVRATWLYTLCGSMVAARVAAGLAERVRPDLVTPLLALVAGDAILGSGLPWRLHPQIGDAPSAYAAAPADRAVLDLWPRVFDRSSGELEMWSRNLSCFYQSQHARPILEVCIGTSVNSPREEVDRWLSTALLRQTVDADGIRARLGGLGVGAVVLHTDVYREADRDALISALDGVFGPAAADTNDGGEHVLLWVVPAVTDANPVATWEDMKPGP